MAYIFMAHIVMAHIVMAHIVMAHIVMAHIIMAQALVGLPAELYTGRATLTFRHFNLNNHINH